MFYDISDINRYAVIFLFLSQFAMAVLLSIAAYKNHFHKKRMRPAVTALAVYAAIGAAHSFLRLLGHTLVENGEEANGLLESSIWMIVNGLYVFSSFALLIVLVYVYPETHHELKKKARLTKLNREKERKAKENDA